MPANTQQPTPPPESVSFAGFSGLTNTVSRTRLDPKELAVAINVDLDDRDQLRRRRGFRRVSTGDFHSLFTADDGRVYGVKNGTLGIIRPNYSFTNLQSVAFQSGEGLASLAYVQVGTNIYFSCPTDSGIIDTVNDVVKPWGNPVDRWLSPVVNPTPGLAEVRGKLLGRPPFATSMAYWNGRIYLAQGRTVWATELYMYDFVDKTRTFIPFEHEVTGIGAVGDGLYIGTTNEVWFLTGPFAELKRTAALNSGMIPGSLITIPSELANPPQIPADSDQPIKSAVMFMTTTGICVAQDSGIAFNLTESKLFFPDMRSATSLYRRQDGVNQFVVVTDTGGTPSSSARIGDYVDAELIRADTRSELGNSMTFGDYLDAEIIRA